MLDSRGRTRTSPPASERTPSYPKTLMATRKAAAKRAGTRTRDAATATKAMSATEIRTALGGQKPKVHLHPLPRCSDRQHGAGCDGKGIELSCNQVTVLGKKFAVCTHLA